jgi:hypothetical protein
MSLYSECFVFLIYFFSQNEHARECSEKPREKKDWPDYGTCLVGELHDQGDAKWIVIREQLRDHNDMPFGRPPAGLSAALKAYLVFLVTIN